MTGLEPATSGVTGRCSNQLSYIPLSYIPNPALAGTKLKIAPDLGKVKTRGLPAGKGRSRLIFLKSGAAKGCDCATAIRETSAV